MISALIGTAATRRRHRARWAVIALVEGGAGMARGCPARSPTRRGMGNLLAVCAPAFALGALALVLAARYPMAPWLRVVTVLGALGGISAPLFFTYVVFVLWALLLGTWLVLRPSRAAAAAPPAASPSIV